jgi:hypothetical protein
MFVGFYFFETNPAPGRKLGPNMVTGPAQGYGIILQSDLMWWDPTFLRDVVAPPIQDLFQAP